MRQLIHDLLSGIGTIDLEEDVFSGYFNLTDSKSCNNCINYFSRGCNLVVVNIETGEDIHVINLEKIILDAKKESLITGGLCDCLLYSDNKITLAEFTCCLPEYLENHTVNGEKNSGKRAKAYNQICNTIGKLRTFERINTKIDSYSSRVALFAYRVKETAFLDKAAKAMISFFNMSQPRTVDMGNGFLFVRHPYPEVYKW